MPTGSSPDRRRFLAGGLIAGGAFVTAASVWEAARAAAPEATAETALLEALCDITIPATDTPGAVAAGVPAFVVFAIRQGLRDAPPDALARLEAVLDTAAGSRFRDLPRARQVEVLTQVDAQTVQQNPVTPWGMVKTLIVSGYYTSEIGASQELTYDPVPGWDPEVAVTPDFRNFSR